MGTGLNEVVGVEAGAMRRRGEAPNPLSSTLRLCVRSSSARYDLNDSGGGECLILAVRGEEQWRRRVFVWLVSCGER